MTAREEVEAVWKLTTECDGSYRHYKRWTVLIQEVHGQWIDFDSWQAALDFTQQRLKEIAEIEEEIATVQTVIVDFSQARWNREKNVWARILCRLTAQRDELKRGMKV